MIDEQQEQNIYPNFITFPPKRVQEGNSGKYSRGSEQNISPNYRTNPAKAAQKGKVL